jgi:hypothetical protein
MLEIDRIGTSVLEITCPASRYFRGWNHWVAQHFVQPSYAPIEIHRCLFVQGSDV